MATAAAPRNLRAPVPLIREPKTYEQRGLGVATGTLVITVILCIAAHAALLVGLYFLAALLEQEPPTESLQGEVIVQDENTEEPIEKDPLTIQDVDPEALNPDVEINYDNERITPDLSVPGITDPDMPVGIENGPVDQPPMSIPAPGGLGIGQGGALKLDQGNVNLEGMAGGYNLIAKKLAGTFYGRSGATRQKALIEGGGTAKTEAAVARGLHWLVRVQHRDGAWRLEGPFADPAKSSNDTAGTAFGLLPFLGAGKTHNQGRDNPFFKPVEKGLIFLIRKQNPRTGDLGGGMYGHALGTIALCEAYGLTQDSRLRLPAQRAVNYLVAAQHSAGGWRYSPGQPGDTSVSGWVIMALKSAQMAGLDVPDLTLRKAVRYLNSVNEPNTQGYAYVGGESLRPTPTMTAVGLLCRQYLQAWGPNNPKLIKGIRNFLETNPPGKMRNMYYYYYATQVMHHFGGESWKKWNEKMREDLVERQSPDGSWSPRGDRHASAGGRLMQTSLVLLTLEVYYRYLPLYYREEGERQQRLLMGAG